jgi:hypothetical protein
MPEVLVGKGELQLLLSIECDQAEKLTPFGCFKPQYKLARDSKRVPDAR